MLALALTVLLAAAVAVGVYVVSDAERRSCFCGVADLLFLLLNVKLISAKARGASWNIPNDLEQVLDKNAHRVAYVSVEDGRTVTYGEVQRMANKFANWARSVGVAPGDVVGMMFPNIPEFVCFWFGISKCGASTALINTALTGKSLAHVINVAVENSKDKVVCIHSQYLEQLLHEDVQANVMAGTTIFVWGPWRDDVAHPFTWINEEWERASDATPPLELRKDLKYSSALMYIYTSGTTGLPKASKISHYRFKLAGAPVRFLAHLTPEDRIYCALPLFHSNGGLLAVSGALLAGCAVVLRKKFSVSKFAEDCVTHRCTMMIYIGELCRYLSQAKPSEFEGQLQLRAALGNGLRPEVWPKFQSRYGVKHIIELYSATEANVGLFNNTGKVGAIGYIPRQLDPVYPVHLLKINPETQQVVRDSAGRCVLAGVNEPGQVVAKISESDPSRRFEGYTDKAATMKKIVTDVFEKGDRYFLSGDLLRRDEKGFFYWVDRIGDTFRWKGENVATAEVAQVIAEVEGVSDVTVYGVAIPGYDGKAGMAALTLDGDLTGAEFNWKNLTSHMSEQLPPYAMPYFFRIKEALELTGTFKHRKVDLVNQGFDPAAVGHDLLYFRDPKSNTVVPLTAAVYRDIVDKVVSL